MQPLPKHWDVINVGKDFYFNEELRALQQEQPPPEPPTLEAIEARARDERHARSLVDRREAVLVGLGHDWRTVAAIGLRAKVHELRVRKALHELVAVGLVERKRMSHSHGSLYRLKGATC